MSLYEVSIIGGRTIQEVRLIEAKSKAAARLYASRNSLQVEKCTPYRAHTLAARGIAIEYANEEDPAITDHPPRD